MLSKNAKKYFGAATRSILQQIMTPEEYKEAAHLLDEDGFFKESIDVTEIK